MKIMKELVFQKQLYNLACEMNESALAESKS